MSQSKLEVGQELRSPDTEFSGFRSALLSHSYRLLVSEMIISLQPLNGTSEDTEDAALLFVLLSPYALLPPPVSPCAGLA